MKVKNPQDVKLHVKLLRLHIQSRNVERAYDHAVQTEKTLAFIDNIDWYECLADIYQVRFFLNGLLAYYYMCDIH